MNHTPTSLRETADAIEALSAGNPIQFRNIGDIDWRDWTGTHPSYILWDFENTHWRPAPAPKIDEETQRALVHFRAGGKIQMQNPMGAWRDVLIDTSNESLQWWAECGTKLRITPAPITRDWSKPEDVPGPVCYLRNKRNPEGFALIIAANDHGPITAGRFRFEGSSTASVRRPSWAEVARDSEHSTDRKTWAPCTITEEAK